MPSQLSGQSIPEYGISASLENLDQIIITHGHVDHFGGLSQVKKIAQKAKVVAHDLTKPVLVNYDERVLVTRKRVADLLVRAGVPKERQEPLMSMYMLGKQSYQSVTVDRGLRDGDMIDDIFQIIHVPGHTPGLVMIQIENILLTADHILPETSNAIIAEPRYTASA